MSKLQRFAHWLFGTTPRPEHVICQNCAKGIHVHDMHSGQCIDRQVPVRRRCAMIRLIFLAVAVVSALLTAGLVLAVAHSWRLGPWRARHTCAPWDHHITDRHGARGLTRYIGRPHVLDTAPVYTDADYELPDADQLAEQAAWERFCADNADVARACRELTEETR